MLFVSQNTEALKVIERMVKRTEGIIGYPNDNKYISLLDFCLMLYNPTHRHLKYLREQYTRISSKQLPQISSMTASDDIHYLLRYTSLNHDQNYALHDDVIGFDELVRYYIRYVNQVMAPEPIRSFDQVDVRGVFTALDNYSNPSYFAEFNKPRRELVLLSTKNSGLTLPDVRSSLRNIKDLLQDEWTKSFPVKQAMDVLDYLGLLKEYDVAAGLLDTYKMATENKNIPELMQSLQSFMDSNTDLAQQVAQIDNHIAAMSTDLASQAEGVAHDSHKIQLNAPTLTLAENNFEEVLIDRKRIIELTKKIMEVYPDVIYVGIQDIWIGLAKIIDDFYNNSIKDDTGSLQKLTTADIRTLNNDLSTYYAQNGVRRRISGVPTSFKQLLNYTNPKNIDAYRDGLLEILGAIADILEINNATVQSLLAIGKKTAGTPFSRLGIQSPQNIIQAKDAFLPVHELVILLQKYGISIKSFADTKVELRGFDASIAALHNCKSNPANKRLFLSGSLVHFINAINKSIDIQAYNYNRTQLAGQQKDQQNEAYRLYGQYMANINGAAEFVAGAANVHEYLSRKEEQLSALLNNIALPDDNRRIQTNLYNIEKTFFDVNLSNNFSDYFFEIETGQTLRDWLNSVSVLETYNNDAEIVDFIGHNKFINAIRNALGAENIKYIDAVLTNDITFEVFAARIVNVLVSESFGRARITDKKRITTKDIIDAYTVYLKNQKTVAYSENLRQVYSHALGATKELSKQYTLQAGGKSTMDKFRHNTTTIADAFPIICATPKDVSKYIAASKGLFDYVIFDEASQLLPGQAIPSIYRAKKAVIIGDPHQMPPNLNASFGTVEQSEDDFDDLGESILDLVLKQPQKQHHLKVHYRSKYNKLFEPSREAIYSNDGIEPIFEAELANTAPIDIIDDLGDEQDEFGYDKNFYKICETLNEYMQQNRQADFCVLFARGDVLAKFKDFLAEIGERQYSQISALYNADKILISTVTNCQGIEGAHAIIYLHHYSSPGSMWFFKEAAGAYKRLNVSITRQREGLKLLLADQRSHWLKACDEKINREYTGPNARKSAELMKALLTSAGEQTDMTYLDRKLGQNSNWFDSPLTEQLYNKLTGYYSERLGNDLKIYSEVGWNLLIPTGDGIDANERNVGFRIDLGVYSVQRKKFVLGIEMDGAMYHSGFDKEHSDYNRQRVLEDKGWELYRIWSTNWLNDNEREFNRLIEQIDNKLSE